MWEAIVNFFANNIIETLVLLLATWVAGLYQRLTGKQMEKMHREALQSALENGIKAGIQLVLKGKLNQDGTVPAGTSGQILAEAQRYVVKSVPDAVRHFELSDRKIVDLLEPKLPISGAAKSLV